MTKQEEEARIAAAVQQQLEKILAAQQKQFSKTMETAIKESLKGVEKANAALRKERKAVGKELDAAQKIRTKAEREADKMAEAYFQGRQEQFAEAARTELLRNLVVMHIEVGKTTRDIAVWLDIPMKFVENIRQLLERISKFGGDKPKRIRIEGNPKLRYSDQGRGGTVWYESPDANFDMWWEFAGGDALVIMDIPSKETWEARTQLPLEQREKILTFIGEQVLIDKNLGNGVFIIGDSVLTFYSVK
ncbi:MAG: hypothetical protein ACKVUS_13685 [Saprospiraceae bacterium]